MLAANPGLAGATVERRASLLSLVLSPVSAEAAAKLRDDIHYETSVTWNEPSQTLTDPPWLLVVKGIFVGTLAFCGIAIVMGIAFGGDYFQGRCSTAPKTSKCCNWAYLESALIPEISIKARAPSDSSKTVGENITKTTERRLTDIEVGCALSVSPPLT